MKCHSTSGGVGERIDFQDPSVRAERLAVVASEANGDEARIASSSLIRMMSRSGSVRAAKLIR